MAPARQVSIQDAYRDLTHQAFAAWARLLVADSGDLASRAAVANVLDLSYRHTSRVLNELQAKGYIAMMKSGLRSWRPSRVIVTRTAAGFTTEEG